MSELDYGSAIGELQRRTATSPERTRGLFANLNRALNVLGTARPYGMANEERGTVLAFEALLIEAWERNAALLGQHGDEAGARELLEHIATLRSAVNHLIE